MPDQPPPSEPTPAPREPDYPTLEGMSEWATKDDVDALFAPVREALSQLKGPKAQQAKKVEAALESTEELLGQLLQIREKLAEEKGQGKGPK
jgi:hypothetical protein